MQFAEHPHRTSSLYENLARKRVRTLCDSAFVFLSALHDRYHRSMPHSGLISIPLIPPNVIWTLCAYFILASRREKSRSKPQVVVRGTNWLHKPHYCVAWTGTSPKTYCWAAYCAIRTPSSSLATTARSNHGAQLKNASFLRTVFPMKAVGADMSYPPT